MKPPVSLYWWPERNFGDAISPMIAEYCAGRAVEWADAGTAEMISTGSLLAFPGIHDRITGASGPPLTIWGSGSLIWPRFLGAARPETRFAALRGPITASHVRGFAGALGDPGLLADRVFGRPATRGGVGIVPHHRQLADPAYIARIRAHGLRLIDVTAEDPREVVMAIASCAQILSGSLHGLIVADSYGIPNAWVAGPGFGPSDYKFFDYFASVGRYEPRRRTIPDCLAAIAAGRLETGYMARLDAIKDALEAAFPD